MHGKIPSTIFTCSTFLSKPNKRTQFTNALSSLMRQHSFEELGNIASFLVINEYDENNDRRFHESLKTLNAEFPFIDIIQKGRPDRGQARTLNMILERIKSYDYWIHWEESWECTRPFLSNAIEIMQHSDVTQLQLNDDWDSVGPARTVTRTSAGPQAASYLEIRQHPSIANSIKTFSDLLAPAKTYNDFWNAANSAGWETMWPLYSLRPSINRVEFYNKLGNFLEDPALWPVRFEWEYAKRWFENGGNKAILTRSSAMRQEQHVSTYHQV